MAAFALFDEYCKRAGVAAASDMARRRLRCEPNDERLLRALVKHWSAAPESAVVVTEYLQHGMDRYGDSLAWRRVYQDLQAERESLEVLHSEYRARLTSSPTNPPQAYLAARVEPDANRALREIERLALRDDACAYAVFDLALCRLGEGRRDEATILARRAARLSPDSSQFAGLVASLDGSARTTPSALELGSPTALFEAVRDGKGDPREWLGRTRIPEAANWLLVWIELARQGTAPGSDAVWQRALGDLRRSVSLPARRAADELENGPSADSPAPCASALLGAGDKAIVLVAMGLRHPEVRARCYDLAGGLAVRYVFPHDYLARVMGETR